MTSNIKNFQIIMFPTTKEPNQARKYQKSCLIHKDSCDHKDCNCDSISIESSNSSICSLLSSDSIEDDAISPSSTSTSTSSSFSSNGPLFKLSDLMDELPIKRGLSKYYQGKSQSFTTLADVESLEDLAKRENLYNKRLKLCRSYCGGFEGQKFFSPKSTILKKSASNCLRSASFSSSTLASRRACSNNLMASCKPRTIPSVQKDF